MPKFLFASDDAGLTWSRTSFQGGQAHAWPSPVTIVVWLVSLVAHIFIGGDERVRRR